MGSGFNSPGRGALLPSQVVASSENRNDGRDRPSEGRVSNQVEDVNLNGYDNLLRASTGGRALLEISCPSFTTSTDPAEDGTWQFTGVPDETCTLTATGPGYLKARGTLTVGSADVNVPANELLAGDANTESPTSPRPLNLSQHHDIGPFLNNKKMMDVLSSRLGKAEGPNRRIGPRSGRL